MSKIERRLRGKAHFDGERKCAFPLLLVSRFLVRLSLQASILLQSPPVQTAHDGYRSRRFHSPSEFNRDLKGSYGSAFKMTTMRWSASLLAFFLASVGAVLGLDDQPNLARKRLAAVLTSIGFVYGLSVFLPSFLIG